jgi:beta-lactamase regulating signal transducer with metallopeptidase domain
VTLLVVAGLFALLAVLLLGPLAKLLANAAWVSQAPRAAVLCWQCIGLGAMAAGMGAGLSVAVAHYGRGFVGGVGTLVSSIFSGHPLSGIGIYDALGLTLAADLGIVMAVVFGSLMARTVRSRARHRRLLDLVAHRSGAYPGTDLISDVRSVAYCVPGLHPRIVLSEGTLRLLGPREIAAVIEHERGHVQERHGLVMLPMVGLKNLFRWIPYARLAPQEIAMLLEMSADDFSARRYGPVTLAAALVDMAASGCAPRCALSATGSDVSQRVNRLLTGSRNSKGVALRTGLLASALVALPIALALAS